MRRLLAPLCIALVLMMTGCSGQAVKADSGKPAPAAAGAELQVEVVHTYFNDDPLGRFTFKLTNPADKTRVGAAATWKALDKDGVIVGTYQTALPPIGPGDTWYYVGGAGAANLTGIPAQAKIEITNKGELKSGDFKSLVTVEKAEFKRAALDLYSNAQSYDVTAVLTSHGDVSTAKVRSAVILTDETGRVIGGDWLDFWSAPKTLANGEKLSSKASVAVSGGTPAKVEVYTWAD